jgi:hypothetical protein
VVVRASEASHLGLLGSGVTAARVPLEHLVQVRILAPQL